LLAFGAVYFVFGIIGFSSIRWVRALPSKSALAAVSGTVTRITMCGSSARGRYAAIDLTSTAGTVASVVVPKIDFLQCREARDRLAKLKPGDQATAWLGRYPTDEETGPFVWALSNHPPAKPGAFQREPLKAAIHRGPLKHDASRPAALSAPRHPLP